MAQMSMPRDRSGLALPADIYRHLMGRDPDDVVIDDDATFDRHLFACVLSVAAADARPLTETSGLSRAAIHDLIDRHFDGARLFVGSDVPLPPDIADEADILRQLLAANRSTPGDDGAWLAAMMARRALEANHLWEDLGLRSRSELTRLMARHFASLSARNAQNMRWKRFLYRMMCEDDGFVLCSTPICSECAEYHLCFGQEDGISRLVREGRAATGLSPQPAPERVEC